MLALCVAASASAAPKARLSTGRVMDQGEVLRAVPGALLGDDFYAEVNSASLPQLYESFRDQLFARDIVRYDNRYTCKHYAALFAELAQTRYFQENFRITTRAKALAIGSVWYVQDGSAGRHAIVQALTERGRIYLEPQTGREVVLSEREEASAYFRFF